MMKLQKSGVILDRVKETYHLKSDKKLAEFLNVKASTVSAWRSRNSLNYDLILNKCKKIDLNWLFYSIDDKSTLNQNDYYDINQQIPQNYYIIPPLFEKDKKNGNKISEKIEYEDIHNKIILPVDFITHKLKSNPEDLFSYINMGDSMSPLLEDKDLVVVNTSFKKPNDVGVYVIKVNNLLSCRRLQAIPGDRIQITCDNKAYSSFIVDNNVRDFVIIGKVLWYCHKL